MRLILLSILSSLANICLAQQNTILLIADDVSPDYFGFYANSDTAATPVLSDLASKGVVFNRAWAYPICSPTRASIMTGRYGFRTGMGEVVAGPNTNQLSLSETSIANVLRNQTTPQYATGIVGKWHLHSQQGNLNNPSILDWQYYSGNFAGAIPDYNNYTKITNGNSSTSTIYSTTEIVNDAISWLDTLPNNQPFFLWVAFNAPHTPFHKPPSNLISEPNLPGTTNHINNNKARYFKAAIDALDSETGRLIQYLNTKGLLDSTNFIFIGDNGSPSDVSKNPINGRSKGTIYNYGVEVPMFISGPAVTSPNRRTDEMVSTVDLFATVADLSGVSNWNPNNVSLDSKSLMPIIKNKSQTHRGYQFSEQFGSSASRDGKSIRNLDYHLIRFDSSNTQEFYKISVDTFETNNLLLSPNSMTASDISNYHLLCDSLALLVGTSSCLALTSSNAFKEYKISIYPNPANNKLYFKSKNEITSFHVCDGQGRKILSKKGKQLQNINIENLANGFYYLQLNNSSMHSFTKY